MKRVLQVLCQKPGSTGSGIFLLALYERAKKRGYEQAVIAGVSQNETDKYRRHLKNSDFFPVQFDSELLNFPVAGMSDVMPYSSTRYRDMTKEMLEQWTRAFRVVLQKAVHNFQPDLVLSHHLWLLTALTRETIKHIPVFGICHGTCLRQLKLAERLSPLAIDGCRKLDGIFALNEYQKESIISNYKIDKNRVFVTGAGYDDRIFNTEGREKRIDTVKLVYAGKLSFSKGVLSLIRAYGKLTEKGWLGELHLAGSGISDEERQIRQLAGEKGGKIVFHGALSQEELANLFRASDILVLPSFYEGLPLVVLEALASGLRVVTTDLPGLKEYLGWEINNSGLIRYVELPRCEHEDSPIAEDLPDFEDRLAEGIKEQINSLIDTSVWQRPGVVKAIADMSWDGVFSRVEDIYLKHLSDKKQQ
ncbi:MAG: glycosyltransferase family 4 protein [Bacillota bacterium]|jgi:glycosyltransferase involved in cell wall biosynthesis